MRVAWTTDIHLEFLDENSLDVYMDSLAEEMFDILLIAGDIGTSSTVTDYLARLARSLHVPIYFLAIMPAVALHGLEGLIRIALQLFFPILPQQFVYLIRIGSLVITQ